MKISKLVTGFAAALVIAFGSIVYVNSGFASNNACETGQDLAASACGKCGDGYCNPRCGETATSCPRDCAGVPSAR